jgi:hypothetical protein
MIHGLMIGRIYLKIYLKELIMSKSDHYNQKQLDKDYILGPHITILTEFWQQHHDLSVDGACGPKTLSSLEDEMDIHPTPLAAMALSIAIDEIGNGEEGGNNSGPHVERYMNKKWDGDDDDDGSWCAHFVSWCFEEAARRLDVDLPFRRSGGAKALYRNIKRAGTAPSTPMPGDVVCWDRGKPGSWQGHIGFVEKVDNGILHTVEGNVGRYPSKAKRLIHDLDRETRLIGFARCPEE